MEPNVTITAVSGVLPGRDLPGCVLRNAELTALMGQVAEESARRGAPHDFPISAPEFPEDRIGIRQRCVLDEDLSARDLAVAAGRRALANGAVEPAQVRFVIVSTVTPDKIVPPIAATVQHALGLPESTPALDIRLGCNGFMAALDVAAHMLHAEPVGAAALVIGAETMIRVLDASDRTTCPIFGDGAGAAVLQRTAHSGMTRVATTTLGECGPLIEIGADPATVDVPMFRFSARAGKLSIREDRLCRQRVRMDGRAVYKDMVRMVPDAILGYLDAHRTELHGVDRFVFHQANLRMIEGIAKSRRLRLPPHKILSNIGDVGNTTSASIPLLLAHAQEHGLLRPGHRVLLVGFGTGYSLGLSLLHWQ